MLNMLIMDKLTHGCCHFLDPGPCKVFGFVLERSSVVTLASLLVLMITFHK